jgi:hypothetical protein
MRGQTPTNRFNFCRLMRIGRLEYPMASNSELNNDLTATFAVSNQQVTTYNMDDWELLESINTKNLKFLKRESIVVGAQLPAQAFFSRRKNVSANKEEKNILGSPISRTPVN